MTENVEAPTLVSNHHNVIILGAGFSADRGLPLVRGFTDSMRDALESTRDNAAREAISRVMTFRRQASSAAEKVRVDLENIEDLFSLATLSPAREVVTCMPLAIAATIDEAAAATSPPHVWVRMNRGLIGEMPVLWQSLALESVDSGSIQIRIPLYEYYWASALGLLSPKKPYHRTTVISFNYDTLVEDALQQLRVPFTYGLTGAVNVGSGDHCFQPQVTGENSPAPAVIQVLKLHGSMNWASPATIDDSPELYDGYRALRSQQRIPSIIPPTWGKTIPEFMADVWSKAREALTTATRVAVIGHSLRRTDAHFRYLLAEGLGQNISLRRIVFVGKESQPSDDGSDEAKDMAENARDLLQDTLSFQRRVGFSMEGTKAFLSNVIAYNGWVAPRHPSVSVSDHQWN